jgi:hypothetical protein
LVTL